MLNLCVYIFTAYAVSGSAKAIMGIKKNRPAPRRTVRRKR